LKTLWPDEPWPAASTIGAILKRHRMVKPRRMRRRTPPRTRPFSHVREANDVWCVDFKGHFTMGNGRKCYPLTVMDAASRYLLACVAMHEPSLVHVERVFVELFRKYGHRRRSVPTTVSLSHQHRPLPASRSCRRGGRGSVSDSSGSIRASHSKTVDTNECI
jgi:transposase InsO family protein